jgi:8-oxo-dGTP pyrophosphatase MutT (NUDIX family)
MMDWNKKSRIKLAESRRLTFFKDIVETVGGREAEYPVINTYDGVIIIPIKVTSKDIKFIMVEQYRYPIGRKQLEFPGGAKENNQTNEEAATKELKEETGYIAKNLRFLYSMNPIPSISPFKTAVYLALIDGEPEPLNIEEDEKDAELAVKEFTADELLKMIKENEITDCKTLAALSVVLLQSPKALEYVNSFA